MNLRAASLGDRDMCIVRNKAKCEGLIPQKLEQSIPNSEREPAGIPAADVSYTG